MSGLNFNITANNSDFKRKLQELDAGVSRTTKAIEASGQSVESYFRKMTAGAAALAAGFSARELVSNIVRTRGEMQQLEVAFREWPGAYGSCSPTALRPRRPSTPWRCSATSRRASPCRSTT